MTSKPAPPRPASPHPPPPPPRPVTPRPPRTESAGATAIAAGPAVPPRAQLEPASGECGAGRPFTLPQPPEFQVGTAQIRRIAATSIALSLHRRGR